MGVSGSQNSTTEDYPARQAESNSARKFIELQTRLANLSFDASLDEIQTQILQGICQTLGGQSGFFAIHDEKNPEQFQVNVLKEDQSWVHLEGVELKEGVLRECLDNQLPLLVSDAEHDPRFNSVYDSIPGLRIHSLLCAPLASHGKVSGALVVVNKQRSPFTFSDQELLVMIANLAAQSMDSSGVIQQLKAINARLEINRGELMRSRNTLRALFDSMPAALYIVDRQYTLIAINMSCSRRTGQPPRELVGRLCYEAIYRRHEPCNGCRVTETFASGTITTRTERHGEIGDEPIDWEISTFPIYNETNQVGQVILLEQDVTEKRRLESIVVQSEKLAAVGQLAAGVAHEINNPLTAIIANAQLLQRELPPEDDMQESIELIIRAGARATQVVRNLLDFARKEQYHLSPTDVNETLQRAMALVQHELVKRSTSLEFEPAQDLPQVSASQDHLLGVWLNLLLNAIDAIDSTQGKIQVNTRRAGNEIRVTIADNGKGIPPERLSRIFEPFYTTKAPGHGTGLGLSVCHRVIKQHGGYIEVDSQLGAGSVFTVVLPVP